MNNDRFIARMKAKGFSWRETNLRVPRYEHPQIGDFVPSRAYMRLGTISLEQGLQLIQENRLKAWVCGTVVDFTGRRLKTYMKGVICVNCGTAGTYFAIERTTPYQEWHANLWGIRIDKSHTLMTSDHIVAKAKGGSGSVENRQTMCHKCNGRKSDKSVEEFLKREKRLRERRIKRQVYAAIVRQFNGAV